MVELLDRAQDEVSAKAAGLAERALAEAFSARGGRITPSTEAAVQNALLMLRREGGDPVLIAKMETISTMLFAMAQALRTGRPNLYASRMIRLRKYAFG